MHSTLCSSEPYYFTSVDLFLPPHPLCVKVFWETLETFDHAQLATLLQFVTGRYVRGVHQFTGELEVVLESKRWY